MQRELETMRQTFRSTPSVYAVSVGSQVVILDVQKDEFLGLNDMAAVIWKLLVEGSNIPLDVVQLLYDGYAVEKERLTIDVLSFVDEMVNRKLLISSNKSSRIRSQSLLSWDIFFMGFIQRLFTSVLRFPSLEANYFLRRVHHHLTPGQTGFFPLIQRIQDLPAHKMVSYEHTEVRRLSNALRVAADWQRFPAACLHQSLALCWMLRQRRMLADVVIGVYTHPFSAHAWVECEREIIQWKAGMGTYPDATRIAAMSIIFHSGSIVSHKKELSL